MIDRVRVTIRSFSKFVVSDRSLVRSVSRTIRHCCNLASSSRKTVTLAASCFHAHAYPQVAKCWIGLAGRHHATPHNLHRPTLGHFAPVHLVRDLPNRSSENCLIESTASHLWSDTPPWNTPWRRKAPHRRARHRETGIQCTEAGRQLASASTLRSPSDVQPERFKSTFGSRAHAAAGGPSLRLPQSSRH